MVTLAQFLHNQLPFQLNFDLLHREKDEAVGN